MKKVCFKCGEEKNLSDFYKHKGMADGHVNKCKECNKKDVRENRNNNVEYYREYDRKRSSNVERINSRYEYANSEHGRKISAKSNRNYYRKNKDKVIESKNKWIEKNPKKRRVHGIVAYALRIGHLNKMPCVVCGNHDSHAHHCDYDKPLDVMWLCPLHHAEWHAVNGSGLNGDE